MRVFVILFLNSILFLSNVFSLQSNLSLVLTSLQISTLRKTLGNWELSNGNHQLIVAVPPNYFIYDPACWL